MKLPNEMHNVLRKYLGSSKQPFLIYGSRARGDYLLDSDLDVLVLSQKDRSAISENNVNISFYTAEVLLSEVSSLFCSHLKHDGIVIRDPDGALGSVLNLLQRCDADLLLSRIRRFSFVFSCLENDLPEHLQSLNRTARYFLRSALYAQAIIDGNECYSVRELADFYDKPELKNLLSSETGKNASKEILLEYVRMLQEYITEFPANEDGSLNAFIINNFGSLAEEYDVALFAITNSIDRKDYAGVRKIIL
ncbi:nucleotidyltransferase domain-containing protein [Corynebacterium sp. ES2730-CONJ]|nr:nucleotidyltransferase domain-containing protein [Corynebacterium sp. ES2730-CONJ]MCS4532152.1 nucleotidyltransferase domain-containing protein [Corynebacterium sp. ES2730-CONJ]